VLIPKSSKREHIQSNFEIGDFTLSPDEVTQIDELLAINSKTDWDPSNEI
jgi:diketogulonate reductase-like aldo/keto reductase